MRKTTDNIVISDVRFPNEIAAIKKAGGRVIRVKRGPEPEWYDHAINFNQGNRNIGWATGRHRLEQLGIHSSETAWVGGDIDVTIDNNGTIDELFSQLENLVKNQEQDLPVSI